MAPVIARSRGRVVPNERERVSAFKILEA